VKNLLIVAALGLTAVGSAWAQTPQERQYIDAAFAAVDVNKDGQITRQEFDTFMMARITKQRSDLDRAFDAADEDGDGRLSREEAAVNTALFANFDKVDTNKDGAVSREELASALAAIAAAAAAAGDPSTSLNK